MSHKVAEDDGRWPMVGSFSLATFAASSIPFFFLFFFFHRVNSTRANRTRPVFPRFDLRIFILLPSFLPKKRISPIPKIILSIYLIDDRWEEEEEEEERVETSSIRWKKRRIDTNVFSGGSGG